MARSDKPLPYRYLQAPFSAGALTAAGSSSGGERASARLSEAWIRRRKLPTALLHLTPQDELPEADEVLDAGVDRHRQGHPEGDGGQVAEFAELVVDDQQGDRDDLDGGLDLAREARRDHQVLGRREAAQRGHREL